MTIEYMKSLLRREEKLRIDACATYKLKRNSVKQLKDMEQTESRKSMMIVGYFLITASPTALFLKAMHWENDGVGWRSPTDG
jgi:hypothetical protein